LLGIRTTEELKTHYAKGALFENFVITEIMKNLYNRGDVQPLYFWRDKTGHEIDLIIDAGGKIHPVEIKASHTIQPRFFNNLNFFNKISGNDPEQSMVIHAGDTNQKRSKGQVRSWDNLPDKI
jgi:predicted AAA+ superfamily ATPase